MRSIRLAVIRQRYTPFGGAERFIDLALRALRDRSDVQVTVIAREWKGKRSADARTVECNPFHIGRVWRLLAFARAVDRAVLRGDFDIVQSHERLSCCDIFRAGDGVHREWLDQRSRILSPLRRFLMRCSPFNRLTLAHERDMFASPRLKVVIANSQRVRADILRHFPNTTAEILVIHNAVDTNHFHPQLRDEYRKSMRSQLGLEEGAPVLLFVGSGFERKGVGPLLQVMAKLPASIRLVIVGKDTRQSHFEAESRRLGVASRVTFVGPQGDVRPYYGMADILVLPSLYDPFPNSVIEAMACAVPVIVSDGCGTLDIIDDKRFVLDALDVDGWVSRIQEALDPPIYRALSQSSRRAAESLTIQKMADQLLAVYLKVPSKSPRSESVGESRNA